MSKGPAPIAITLGDPAGVGPEVIVKALSAMSPEARTGLVVVGSTEVLGRAAKLCGVELSFAPDQAAKSGDVRVREVPVDGLPIPFGKIDAIGGEAAFRYVEAAVRLTVSGETAALVTAPINKEALNSAGRHYDGHTGMLAELTGAPSSFMLLASEKLSTIHVSTHVSLAGAIKRATTVRVLETIRAGDNHFRRLGIVRPRIAVAGLNPHCGENGLFGSEDHDAIKPAVTRAQAEGIDVVGPISADNVFLRAFRGSFDLVVAQYHDQGHIPMKLVAFDTTVNVSLGLPIDRTSVDHGTAFDIAGTGRADHVNMLAAIAYARRLGAAPRLGGAGQLRQAGAP